MTPTISTDETRPIRREQIDRLEVAITRQEVASQRQELATQRLETIIVEREKNCIRHRDEIRDLYERQDKAKSWLLGVLMTAIAGLIPALWGLIKSGPQ